jgi:hypothetical protein
MADKLKKPVDMAFDFRGIKRTPQAVCVRTATFNQLFDSSKAALPVNPGSRTLTLVDWWRARVTALYRAGVPPIPK